jgi:ribosomal protein S18 acetylase RimI-like enzyme
MTMSPDAVTVREATTADLPSVLNVLDNGLLAVDVPTLKDAIDDGDVLVAVETETILGALALDGAEITAVAVRRRRRDQGIGRRLVAAASERRSRLVAEFDERVRPFWDSLGFEIEPIREGNRLRGRLDAGDERE